MTFPLLPSFSILLVLCFLFLTSTQISCSLLLSTLFDHHTDHTDQHGNSHTTRDFPLLPDSETQVTLPPRNSTDPSTSPQPQIYLFIDPSAYLSRPPLSNNNSNSKNNEEDNHKLSLRIQLCSPKKSNNTFQHFPNDHSDQQHIVNTKNHNKNNKNHGGATIVIGIDYKPTHSLHNMTTSVYLQPSNSKNNDGKNCATSTLNIDYLTSSKLSKFDVTTTKTSVIYVGLWNNDVNRVHVISVIPSVQQDLSQPLIGDASTYSSLTILEMTKQRVCEKRQEEKSLKNFNDENFNDDGNENKMDLPCLRLVARWKLPKNSFTLPSNLEYKFVYTISGGGGGGGGSGDDDDVEKKNAYCHLSTVCSAENCGIAITEHYQQFEPIVDGGVSGKYVKTKKMPFGGEKQLGLKHPESPSENDDVDKDGKDEGDEEEEDDEKDTYVETFYIYDQDAIEYSFHLLFNMIARDKTQPITRSGVYRVFDSRQDWTGKYVLIAVLVVIPVVVIGFTSVLIVACYCFTFRRKHRGYYNVVY